LSNYVVNPDEVDSIKIAKIAESADFIKKQSNKVKRIIEDGSRDKGWKDQLSSLCAKLKFVPFSLRQNSNTWFVAQTLNIRVD
jgi:hypothetical protein